MRDYRTVKGDLDIVEYELVTLDKRYAAALDRRADLEAELKDLTAEPEYVTNTQAAKYLIDNAPILSGHHVTTIGSNLNKALKWVNCNLRKANPTKVKQSGPIYSMRELKRMVSDPSYPIQPSSLLPAWTKKKKDS